MDKKENHKKMDRVRFFKGLRVLAGVGGSRYSDNMNLTPDASSAKFRSHWNAMIWIELQAWHNDRSVFEQDEWLVANRQAVIGKSLEEVENFSFCGNVHHIKNGCPSDCHCFMKNSTQALPPEQLMNYSNALKQVCHVLDQVSFAESLYSSSVCLSIDHPKYKSESFSQKRDVLCTWFNTFIEMKSSFISMMEFLDLLQYNEWLETLLEIPDICEGLSLSVKPHSPFSGMEEITHISCCHISDAIATTMDTLLRKFNVKTILSILLKKHFTPLMRAFYLIIQTKINQKYNADRSKQQQGDFSNPSVDAQSVILLIKETLPNLQLNEISLQYTEPAVYERFNLPYLDPLYILMNDVMFAVMSRCLTARLEQVASCQQNCGSSTSILTTQQVVFECKEVIQCCLLSLEVHCLFLKPFNGENENQKANVVCFRNNLLKIFGTYLDFVKLWVVGQLTGLPHAPRGIMEILETEWKLAQKISVKIDIECFITCACKCTEICKDVFISTQNFLTSAAVAIIVTRSETPSSDEFSPNEFFQPTNHHLQHSNSYPTSPKAGFLWFHRQRSESRHLANRHSIIRDGDSSIEQAKNCFLPINYNKQDSLEMNNTESTRRYLYELSRAIRDLFDEARERTMKAVTFAKSLRKDLEPCIEFNYVSFDVKCKHGHSRVYCSKCGLLSKLKANRYILVEFKLSDDVTTSLSSSSSSFHPHHHWIFISQDLIDADQTDDVKMKLLHRFVSSCSTAQQNNPVETLGNSKKTSDAILFLRVLSHMEHQQTKKSRPANVAQRWTGEVLTITEDDLTSFNHDVIKLMNLHMKLEHDFTAVSKHGMNLGQKRSELLKLFGPYVTMVVAQSSIVIEIKESLKELHIAVLSLCDIVLQQVNEMSRHLQYEVNEEAGFTRDEEPQLFAEINQVVQKNFYFGFECMREAVRIFSGKLRHKMELLHLKYLKTWMDYVMEFIPRGKGKKPKWAACGLNSLVSLSMEVIKSLPDDEYNKLNELISKFLDHLIGTRNSHEVNQPPNPTFPNTQEVPMFRSFSSNSSKEENFDSNQSNNVDCYVTNNIQVSQLPLDQINITISEMEARRDDKRMEKGIIGRVIDTPNSMPVIQLGIRTVSFRWQRGTKIGEGTFGRVYTCVNMDNGKLLAMKEIPFQPNDEHKIKEILDEITNFEGITHQNLVKYYGVELHRDQMYIFMEYCDSGTLEEVSRIGLPEVMIQQYTSQIVAAVSVLHQKGIVHRDIKGGNIFLTSNGLLKIGDFGSAVRLLDRSQTLPGEIASHTGITAAYTAPEVINSNVEMGYGRAADVWSIGCVVIEMAAGKRPWHDHEPFQIMYKVGMGCKPIIPTSLSSDGKDFVERCIEISPTERWTTSDLQTHPFIKVAHLTSAS
nr:mitogen-activated protein kinase kinase kinase 4 isoform X1 [Ciona intestinalis]|eukprot:XP_009861526.2 mitogen-activated protein kinase kinase kinase 4 isoform X1 [Ciona intestinalis]